MSPTISPSLTNPQSNYGSLVPQSSDLNSQSLETTTNLNDLNMGTPPASNPEQTAAVDQAYVDELTQLLGQVTTEMTGMVNNLIAFNIYKRAQAYRNMSIVFLLTTAILEMGAQSTGFAETHELLNNILLFTGISGTVGLYCYSLFLNRQAYLLRNRRIEV